MSSTSSELPLDWNLEQSLELNVRYKNAGSLSHTVYLFQKITS